MSAPIKSDEIDAHLKATRGLERDLLGEVFASRKVAWIVAGVATGLTALSFAAAIVAMNRDAPPPVVLRVDNSTGAVDVVSTMQTEQTSYGEVIDAYWLNQYVLNREGYDWFSIQKMYETAALLSAPSVQKEYAAIYQGPQARDKVLKNSKAIAVAVISLTPDAKSGTAAVRFTTQEKALSGQMGPVQHWIATIGYSYSGARMKAGDRLVNPLGFQVTSYRADPEMVGAQ